MDRPGRPAVGPRPDRRRGPDGPRGQGRAVLLQRLRRRRRLRRRPHGQRDLGFAAVRQGRQGDQAARTASGPSAARSRARSGSTRSSRRTRPDEPLHSGVGARRRQPSPPTSLYRKRTRVAAAFAVAVALAVLCSPRSTSPRAPRRSAPATCCACSSAPATPVRPTVLVASRLPRLLAALVVGVALGVAGAGLQSLARNALASPDTLAVNAGAYLAVVAVVRVRASAWRVLPSGGARVPRWPARRRPRARPVVRRRVRADPADPGRHRGRARARLADLRAPAALRAEHHRPVRAGAAARWCRATSTRSTRLTPVVVLGVVGLLLARPPARHPGARRRPGHRRSASTCDAPGSSSSC